MAEQPLLKNRLKIEDQMVVEMGYYYAIINKKILAGLESNNSYNPSKEKDSDEYVRKDDLYINKPLRLRRESWLLNRLRCWSCGLYQGDADLCDNCKHRYCSIEEKNRL